MENNGYTIKEVAGITGKNPQTIRRWLKDGKLPHITITGEFGPEYRITDIPMGLRQSHLTVAEELDLMAELTKQFITQLDYLIRRIDARLDGINPDGGTPPGRYFRLSYASRYIADNPDAKAEDVRNALLWRFGIGLRTRDILHLLKQKAARLLD